MGFRYANKTNCNKLSLFTEAFGKNRGQLSMSYHVSELETILSQLEEMAIFLSSIKEDREYEAVIAAIRTMEESKTTWESVTVRQMDEYKVKKSQKQAKVAQVTDFRAAVAKKTKTKTFRKYCKKKVHTENRCWNNSKSGSFNGDFGSRDKHNSEMSPSLAVTLRSKTFKKALCGMACVNPQDPIENNMNAKAQTLAKEFISDTEGTHHMCCSEEFFQNLKTVPRHEITLGDNRSSEGDETGEVNIVLNTEKENAKGSWKRLTNVLYLPDIGKRLVSLNALDEHENHVRFQKGLCIFTDRDTHKKIGKRIKREDGLFMSNRYGDHK